MGFARKIIEMAAYKAAKRKLNTMTLDEITVEAVMGDFFPDGKQKNDLAKAGLTEDDIRQIVENIVPKLRKEKEKRLK